MSAVSTKYQWHQAINRARVRGRPKEAADALLHLFNDEEGGVAWPSMAFLGREMGAVDRTARRAVQDLNRLGWIRVEMSKGRSSHRIFWSLPAVSASEETTVNPDSYVSGLEGLENAEIAKLNPDKNACFEASNPDTYVSPYTLDETLVRGTPNGSPLYAECTSNVVGESSFNDPDEQSVPDAPLEGAGTFRGGDTSEISAAAQTVYSAANGSNRSTVVPPSETSAPASDPEFDDDDCPDNVEVVLLTEEEIEAENEWRMALPDEDEDLPSVDRCMDPSVPDEDEELSVEERIAELEESIQYHSDVNETRLPGELTAFPYRDDDPSENELARLEQLLTDIVEKERDEIERHNAEIEAARAAVAAQKAEPPLAERIHDPVRRADYVGRMVAHLLPLDAEPRHSASRFYRNKIVAELKQTLPRFRAEALAGELEDEILTQLWRRERGQVVDVMPALVPRAAYPSSSAGRSQAHG